MQHIVLHTVKVLFIRCFLTGGTGPGKAGRADDDRCSELLPFTFLHIYTSLAGMSRPIDDRSGIGVKSLLLTFRFQWPSVDP